MQRPPHTDPGVTPLLWLPWGCLSCPPSITNPGCQPPRLPLTGPQKCPVLSHSTVALHIPFLVPETLFLHLPSPTSLIFLENPFLYSQAHLCCPFLVGLLQVPG